MGISDDLLVNPRGAPHSLCCAICAGVHQQPVFYSGRPCGHTSPLECAYGTHRWRADCSSCLAPVYWGDRHCQKVIRSLLDELLMHCQAGRWWTGIQVAELLSSSYHLSLLLLAEASANMRRPVAADSISRKRRQVTSTAGNEIHRDSMSMEDARAAQTVCISGGIQDQEMRDPAGMQIFVRVLTGRTLVLKVDAEDSIDAVKHMIRSKTGIPGQLFYLTYAGKSLMDSRLVSDYNLSKDSMLTMLLRFHSTKKWQASFVEPTLKRRRCSGTFGAMQCD